MKMASVGKIGPVKPDIYPYCFVVDNIQVADPVNPLIFANERFKFSLVDIPGDQPLIHSVQNVPHGNISTVIITLPRLEGHGHL